MRARYESLLVVKDQLADVKSLVLPCFDHPYHFHPEIEFVFIEKSRGTCVIGDRIGSFDEGQFYLLGANLPHVFHNDEAPEDKAQAVVIHLSLQQLEARFGWADELSGFLGLMGRCSTGFLYDPETSGKVVCQMRRIGETTGPARLAALFELAAILLDAPEPLPLASAGYLMKASSLERGDRIQEACDIILRKYMDENLNHAEVANQLRMSPACFSRLFQRALGKTFTRFVTEVRLGHACRLLTESDGSVTQIAYASGFSNLSNFNRRFRERYGRSPREYRNTCRNTSEAVARGGISRKSAI
jgi:AraC-like DNA-binding protein